VSRGGGGRMTKLELTGYIDEVTLPTCDESSGKSMKVNGELV